LTRLLAYLPRGNTLDDRAWRKRHAFLQVVLLLHLPSLYLFGIWMGRDALDTAVVLAVPTACLALGRLVRHRRTASVLLTAGLTYCSAVLVSFSGGSIEAHFHFFIMIGFIALYQDWVPFLWYVVFTVLSHGLGSALRTDLIFVHPAGQTSPWVWSAIHGVAVLAACCGVVIFWETTEQEQRKSLALTRQLAEVEIGRRRFTSDLLVNLARRNQSLLYRQLGLINQLEDQEEDPDALADLFRLDHLATRIRRNAESLLVLSGEEPPRTWGRPVALVDVVRAAIAETEDLDRVVFAVDERLAVPGNAVADLTHLVAELVENAVHFSPPEASVIIRTRPHIQSPGAHVLTVEDWGVGMRPEELMDANDLMAAPRDVDLSVSQRLGLHVVARLAQRHGIGVSLTPTPGCGVTAAVVLPPSLFEGDDAEADDGQAEQSAVVAAAALAGPAVAASAPAAPPGQASWAPAEAWADVTPTPGAGGGGDGRNGDAADWSGWWEPSPDEDLLGGHAATPPTAPLPPLAQPIPQASQAPTPTAPAAPPAMAPAAPPAMAPAAAPASAPQRAMAPGPPPAPVAPRSQHAAEGPAGMPGALLSRRVPQAHLAPELRRPATPTPAPAPAVAAMPDATDARAALSRYQASRQAARAIVDDGEAGGRPPRSPVDEAADPDRPAGNGGWS
jgi:histidine kinase/DNA gyrase B/HSP90-like ATPase